LGCFVCVSSFAAFFILVLLLEINHIKNQNEICCKLAESKTTEGMAWGVSKRAEACREA